MRSGLYLTLFVAIGSLGLGLQIEPPRNDGMVNFAPISFSTAAAAPRHQARRVSRRTARRTTRRVNYRQSVSGCAFRAPYYYCGGVYYRPVVQSGTTVYVVVNP